MKHWEFARNITSMRLTAEMAVDLGMSLHDCLAGTRVDAHQLVDPNQIVTAQQELRLIRNLMDALGHDRTLGLRAGMRYHFTAYGALGFAIVSSRSARSALDVALQYFHLTSAFTRFVVSDTDTETCVCVEDDDVPQDVAAFVVERDIAALITVARDLYALEPMLRRLRFRANAPDDAAPYQDFFRVDPVFGAPSNLVIFDRTRLEKPLPQANETMRTAAMTQCQNLLEAHKSRSGLALTVRNHLLSAAVHMPTMDTMATELCLTERTLRRRLHDEGTTFAELRDEVRQTLAEALLSDTRLGVTQIAERLGYAEPTSFINAFKRWRGQTPYVFRRAHRPRLTTSARAGQKT